ncbi:hypothetical protein [Phytomonospora endophytica]|uniref:ABM domain-containing protein n=1 Tax=Phytomonospora endophytica TaxID=714109 RepID=A0A841FWP9_9ACTN|nr:hypothetical protein [Phytomonospora endophytica]MBB6037767.1 hypothetical protein [Phytomonospora endophytica]GIG67703.1 hypothetical protein Pen01_39980 [Phytomonospora endophytica]
MRVHVHHYGVDDEVFDEFLRRRAAVIDAVRSRHPALNATTLVRLEDGGYTDTWQWDDAEAMGAAFASLPDLPEAGAAMSLTTGATGRSGEVVAVR